MRNILLAGLLLLLNQNAFAFGKKPADPAPPPTSTPPPASQPAEAGAVYRARYRLADATQKLVDNKGNGYENLYGVRNFRAVLGGIYYRGGANNAYHRTNKRGNENPLPSDGLQNLTESLLAARVLSPGVYLVMHNQVFPIDAVRKDRELAQFVRK